MVQLFQLLVVTLYSAAAGAKRLLPPFSAWKPHIMKPVVSALPKEMRSDSDRICAAVAVLAPVLTPNSVSVTGSPVTARFCIVCIRRAGLCALLDAPTALGSVLAVVVFA